MKNNKNTQFNIDEVIDYSGHDFHNKVINCIKEKGWQILDSQYYVDIITKKRREIDIIATKEFEVRNRLSDASEKIKFNLYIDAKYVNNHNVFWLEEKDEIKAKKLALDNFVFKSKADNFLENTSTVPNLIHHYVDNNKACRKWASEKRKGYKDDIFFNATEQVLHSLIYYRLNKNSGYNEIHYPVIVIDSLKKIYKKEDNKTSLMNDNFQIQIDYSYMIKELNIDNYFLIDVVAYDKLLNFIDLLESNDIKLLSKCLSFDLRHKRMERKRYFENENDSITGY